MSELNAYINVEAGQATSPLSDAYINAESAHRPLPASDAYINADIQTAADAPLPATTKYSTAVLADSPMMYLKCQDESGTTLVDSSGNGRNATISGTGAKLRGVTEAPSPSGLGYHVTLDGIAGHITLPTGNWLLPNSTGFTVEMWLYVRAYNNNSKVFDFSSGATNDLWAGFSNTPRMLTYVAGTTNTSPNYPASGEWHHFTFTSTAAGAMNIYIDGALHSSATLGTIQAATRNSLYIGRSNLVSGTSYLAASVSHIAVYNKVLTPAQITAHVRAAGTATDDLYNLVYSDRPWGYWILNEQAGETVFKDHSPIPTRNMALTGTLSAFNLDGPRAGSSGVSFPNNNSTNLATAVSPTSQAFTAEVWVRFAANPAASSSIISAALSTSSTSTGNEIGVWLGTDGKVNFSLYTTTVTTLTSPTALATNTWHHIVATYSPTGAMTLRVNKTTVASTTKAPLTTPYSRVVRLHAGYNHVGGAISISNAAWYKGSLPTAVTDEHYDTTIFYDVGGTQLTGVNLQPFTNGVTGYWNRPLAGTSYEYRIDGGDPVSLTTDAPYFISTSVPTGTHTFEVRVKAGETVSDWSTPRTFTSQSSQSFLREIFKDSPTMYVPLDATDGQYESWPRGIKWEASPGVTRTRNPLTRNSTYAASGNGVNGIASVTLGPTQANEQTFEIWMRMPATGDHVGTLLASGSGVGITWHLSLLTGRELGYSRATGSTFGGSTGTGVFFPETATATNYHVALRRIGDAVSVYVNGRLVFTDTPSSVTAAYNSTYRIGARFSDTSWPLPSTVYVDSVAFYNQALSPLRILEHSRAGHQLTAQTNNTAYPLNGGAFFIHEPHPAAAYTDITLDNGATYLTPSYEDIVKEDHPSLYYRLTEATGTSALDSSENSLHGEYQGTYSLHQSGALNSALPDANFSIYTPGGGGVSLPSTSMPLPAQTSNEGYWVSGEAWINPDDITGVQSIMGRSDYHLAAAPATRMWSFHMVDGVLEYTSQSSTGTVRTVQAPETPIVPGEWTHVAFSVDRNRTNLMINGVVVARLNDVVTQSSNTTIPFRIGFNSDSSRNFRGYIQDVAYYRYALSVEQAARHYIAGRNAKYWGWAKIPGLTNDTPVQVRARVANSYMNPPTLSAAVSVTPNSDRYVTLVDRFDGTPRSAPGHPPYGLGPWSLDLYALVLPTGFGAVRFSNSTNNVIVTTKSTPNLDLRLEMLHATTHSDRASGIVGRSVEESNSYTFLHTSIDSRARIGYTDAFFYKDLPTNTDTLRMVARKSQIYMLHSNKVVATVEDPQYSDLPAYQNKTLYAGFRVNGSDPDVYTSAIAWNKAPDDEEFSFTAVGDDAYLYKGRVSRVLDEPTYEP